MAHTFRFLDDIAMADLAFEACGESLHDVFQGATDAVIHAMADPQTVGTAWQQVIEREEDDPASLLFDWLSDLVYWKDAAGVVFHRANVRLVQRDDGRWALHGAVYGEPVKAGKQELRSDIKGVTKHLYRLARGREGWTVRVVLDV